MSLIITDRSNVLAEISHEFVERRLRFALSRFGSKVRNVSVVLSDENRPRGGIDKACRIIVEVNRSRDVIVTDQDAEVKVCIARAAERVGRAVARSIERTRSFDRFNVFDLDSMLPPR